MRPPAHAAVLHHGLPDAVPRRGPGPCSKQILAPSSAGPPRPKQTSQRKLLHVRQLQRRRRVRGSGQDAGAVRVQLHRPQRLPAPPARLLHPGAPRLTQGRRRETRTGSVQPREGHGAQSPRPRLLHGDPALGVRHAAGGRRLRLSGKHRKSRYQTPHARLINNIYFPARVTNYNSLHKQTQKEQSRQT